MAFLAKQIPQTKKPRMSSYRTMLYPVTGKSCWYTQSCLWHCFSGTNFEDMIASLTWLTTLPLSDAFRTSFIDASPVSLVVVYFFHYNNQT